MGSRSISGELTQKIILAIAILVLGGIFGIILFAGRVSLEAANKNAESTLESYIENVEGIVKEVETMHSFVVWQLGENTGNTDYSVITDAVLQYNPMAVSVTIASAKSGDGGKSYQSLRDIASGKTVTRVTDDFQSEPWYVRAIADNKGVWSEPYTRTGDVIDAVVTYSVPLIDSKGEIFAVMAVDISCESITNQLFTKHYYENSYAVIVSDKGTFLSHPLSFMMMTNITDFADKHEDAQFIEQAKNMLDGGTGVAVIKSQKSAAIFGPVSNGWHAAIITPMEELFGASVKFQLLLLLIALGDLIVLYFVTKTIINRTLLPITEVTYLAKNIAKGNFKASVPQVEGTTEMFHLHEALRNMLRSINDYISQLKTTTAANERFESELAIASHIQQQMLRTDFINDADVDLFAKLKPAKEVGGDMYDFLRADRTVYFAVGDVSGKGVPAALYMAISRSLFHYVSGMSLSTSSIVSCINSSFCSGNESNMFITMFVGRLDLDTRELVFCNAGHNPIIIISPDGKASYVHAKSNLAAGVFDTFPYEKESIIIEKGSRLLIYTDGVTEAEDRDKNQYGEDRLLEFAENIPVDTPSEDFVEALITSVKAFTGDNDQNDDITIMSVKV